MTEWKVPQEMIDQTRHITDLTAALDDLQRCEATYRHHHDVHGDGSLAAGQAWDRMRRAGHRARQLLQKAGFEPVDPQAQPSE